MDGKFYDRRISEITSPLTLDIASGRISVFSNGKKINPEFSYSGNVIEPKEKGPGSPIMVLREDSLENTILKNCADQIVFSGDVLEKNLENLEYMSKVTDFLVFLYLEKMRNEKNIVIHLDANFNGGSDKINLYKHFNKPREFTDREFLWYSCLDRSMGGAVGYPGYEHPSSEEEFRAICSGFCENFLLGKNRQLERLVDQFKEFKESKEKIEKAVGKFK